MRLFEFALVDIEVEAVLFKDGKYFIDYFSVVLQVLFMHLSLPWARMHSHVIHVDGELSTGYLVAEQGIHHGLEGRRRVAESEEHYGWLV